MDDNIAIKVDNVSKDFILPHEKVSSLKGLFTSVTKDHSHTADTQHALKNISFEIKKGEFFGIVGRNGSGKSTMLKILAGIYQPTTGITKTSGKLVPFIELGVGFNPELSGRDNVFLNGAMLGFSQKEVQEMYKGIVEFAELEKFMDQKLKNYSSGMQVRLAFSMATRANADILLVDEVLAVGDTDFQEKCFSYFRELKRKKKTVIFVSHDMSAVREYCDRAVLIDAGKIAFSGNSENTAKAYSKLFLPKDENSKSKKVFEEKWGNGGVDIIEITANKKIITNKDENISIEYKVKANKDFDDGIIPGITIKNEGGQPICGTNGTILNKQSPKIKEGDVISVKWTVPNVFNEGSIVIEPAIVDGTSHKLCQWWDNALRIRISNEEKTPYPVAPKILLTMEAS